MNLQVLEASPLFRDIRPEEISGMLSLMSASVFKALSRAALLAPSRSVVLPVTMRPSPSSMATAGPPVSSALSLAA